MPTTSSLSLTAGRPVVYCIPSPCPFQGRHMHAPIDKMALTPTGDAGSAEMVCSGHQTPKLALVDRGVEAWPIPSSGRLLQPVATPVSSFIRHELIEFPSCAPRICICSPARPLLHQAHAWVSSRSRNRSPKLVAALPTVPPACVEQVSRWLTISWKVPDQTRPLWHSVAVAVGM
jgi:hypothetical protein